MSRTPNVSPLDLRSVFSKMFNRYHHLGEKNWLLFITGKTGLAIHGDGETDLARSPVRAFGRAILTTLHAMAMLVREHSEIGASAHFDAHARQLTDFGHKRL